MIETAIGYLALESFETPYGLLRTSGISVLLLFLCSSYHLHAGQPATGDAQAAAERLQNLLEQQAHKPDDATINYNVGVAQFRAKQYASAAKNFMRAHKNAGKNKTLEKRAQFNTAKGLELETLAMLPDKWEDPKVDVDSKLLDTAISTMENACSWYKKDANDAKTQKNLEKAEETLKKLKRKKKQEQQKQDKKDQNKDKDKDKKDDKKDQDQKQNEQNKQDQQDENKSKDQNQKNNTSDQQNDSQKNDQKNDGSKDQPSDDNAVKNDQEKDDKKQNKGGGQQKPQPSDQEGKERDQQQANGKNTDNQKNNSEQSAQHGQPQGSEEQKQPSGANSMDGDDKKQESMQERRMRAVLENLQASEGKQQKSLILQQLQGSQQPQHNGQKPW